MTTTAAILRYIRDRFLVVPIGTIAALLWVNTEPESYFRFAHRAAFAVNDIGMALVLGLMAQRVFEALMPGGALNHWRHWGAAIAAAAGGAAGALLAYYGYVTWRAETVLATAWPVTLAVDIVAGYYLLQAIFGGRRAPALAFFLLTAVLLDSAGLVIVARNASAMSAIIGAALILTSILVVWILRDGARVQGLLPYVVSAGAFAWMGFDQLGLYPALALVPIVPFLPHAARSHALLAEGHAHSATRRSEHGWNTAVQIVLFLFGLVNGGVMLGDVDTGAMAIGIATLAGRPAGIVAGAAIARLAGLHLPDGMTWRDVIVAALATSAGFTFMLMFAAAALPVGAILTQIKIGTLGTVAGAALTAGIAWALGAGRFAIRRER
jgi:NhaA family Na+:H+ antiporter